MIVNRFRVFTIYHAARYCQRKIVLDRVQQARKSLFKDDCNRGQDYHNRGERLNSTETKGGRLFMCWGELVKNYWRK